MLILNLLQQPNGDGGISGTEVDGLGDENRASRDRTIIIFIVFIVLVWCDVRGTSQVNHEDVTIG